MIRRTLMKVLDHRLAVAIMVALMAFLATIRIAGAQIPSPQGLVSLGATPAAAPLIPHTLVGRDHCLVCHTEGIGGAPTIPANHGGYDNENCRECHQQSDGSIEAPTPTPQEPAALEETPGAAPVIPTLIAHPPGEGLNSCLDCHIELGGKHTKVSEMWQVSVHGKAQIGCADCHGGDPRTDEMNLSMSPEAGFIGVPGRLTIPGICGGCHSDVERMRQYNLPNDQYIKYIDSVHGIKVKEGDTKVAHCADCHGSHDVKRASDPSADVYLLNIPDLCARCHSDATLMESYDIPTNQFDIYKNSVHGKALLIDQDMRAPTCASCHGSHAAKPPQDEEVVNVCGKCHTATQSYYEESLHSRIGDAAPKCWTCHGTHDVFQPDESMFIHPEPLEQQCGTCHADAESFRMDRSRFAFQEDRRCDTCHHPGSWIMVQVSALHAALTEADQAYQEAEGAVQLAAAQGMIVTEAESRLAEARTSLISARAAVHTTKLTLVSQLTGDAVASANSANEIAADRLSENIFRRKAMVIAIVAIAIIVTTLYVVKRDLDQQLEWVEPVETISESK